jgi:hypothetical protein
MQKACDKAVELAPRIEELSEEAARLLGEAEAGEALPKEEEVLKLLEEIAENFPKQDQGDEGDDQQDQQENRNEQQEQQQQKPKEQDQQRKVDAEAVLRKAQERERKHKEEQQKMMEALGRARTVEKDW